MKGGGFPKVTAEVPFARHKLRITVVGCRRGALFLEATTNRVVRTFWRHARLQG